MKRPFESQLAALPIVTLVALGCARDQEPQTAYIQGQVQYGGQAGQPGMYPDQGGAPGYYGQPVAGQAPGGFGGMAETTPTAMGGMGGTAGDSTTPAPGVGGTAIQIDPGAAAMIQPVINELAKAHTVAGAKPLGSPLVGNFNTGQTLETTIQLQPQKCYTVVATALPPVTDLNVQLLAATPIPSLSPVLATDSETGPTGVIGKKPNCYKWALPLPTPVKVVLQVTGGTGLAAAQVYEK